MKVVPEGGKRGFGSKVVVFLVKKEEIKLCEKHSLLQS